MPKLHTRSYLPYVEFPRLEEVAHLAPFIAGEACPHCRIGDLIPGKFKTLVCELDHCREFVPESFYVEDPFEATPPEPIADGRTYVLEGFPDYEFDSLGTPTRVTARSKGPKPNLGPVKPIRTSKSSRYYNLTGLESRIVITDKKLQTLIIGKRELPTGWFELDDFPRSFFDEEGNAFSKVGHMLPHRHTLGVTDYGFEVKRFKLYHGPTDSYQYITNEGARKMRSGTSDLKSADVPDWCSPMAPDYPDYCADTETGQPYRISSPRYHIYAPRKCEPRESDGKFYVADYSGKRRLLSSNQILDIISSPYYMEPTPEQPDTSVADILADLARKSQEERKELLGR